MFTCVEAWEETRPYLAKAYEFLSQDKFLVEQESDRLARLRHLGGE
jgi:hypothetical protein